MGWELARMVSECQIALALAAMPVGVPPIVRTRTGRRFVGSMRETV